MCTSRQIVLEPYGSGLFVTRNPTLFKPKFQDSRHFVIVSERRFGANHKFLYLTELGHLVQLGFRCHRQSPAKEKQRLIIWSPSINLLFAKPLSSLYSITSEPTLLSTHCRFIGWPFWIYQQSPFYSDTLCISFILCFSSKYTFFPNLDICAVVPLPTYVDNPEEFQFRMVISLRNDWCKDYPIFSFSQ